MLVVVSKETGLCWAWEAQITSGIADMEGLNGIDRTNFLTSSLKTKQAAQGSGVDSPSLKVFKKCGCGTRGRGLVVALAVLVNGWTNDLRGLCQP